MKLKNLLSEKRPDIVQQWRDITLESYPAETAGFMKMEGDMFINPIGRVLSDNIDNLFGQLLDGIEPEKTSMLLDNIIRVRAVQDFAPSQAVSFILALKKIIRELPEIQPYKPQLSAELVSLESRIDDLALISFDIYMKCREKLYELRANESKRRNFRLLQRANIIGAAQTEEDF